MDSVWSSISNRILSRHWLKHKLTGRSSRPGVDFDLDLDPSSPPRMGSSPTAHGRHHQDFSEEKFEILAHRFGPKVVKKIKDLFDSDLTGDTFELREQIKTRDQRRRQNLPNKCNHNNEDNHNTSVDMDMDETTPLTWYGTPKTPEEKLAIQINPEYAPIASKPAPPINPRSLLIDEPDLPPKYNVLDPLGGPITPDTLWRQQRQRWTDKPHSGIVEEARLIPISIDELPAKALPLIYDQMVVKGKSFTGGRGMKLKDALVVMKAGWIATDNWPPKDTPL